MSRLGDLIHTERLRQGLTAKQVARKCGMSENYILAVEAGTRIIADDQARRILRTIGLRQQTEADFSLDDVANAVDLAQVQPQMAKAVAPKPKPPEAVRVASTEESKGDKAVSGSVWLDALRDVVKSVPVMNAVLQPVDHRLLPILQGKIEGANPEKVFYFKTPDDSMRGFRIHSGDLALIVPAQSPVDGAVMLVEYKSHRNLRKIKKLDAVNILLQTYDREYEAESVSVSDCVFLGRVCRVEFEL
ncbi:MAG: helix-turn-helix domain-containing protein [Clostridia bacterium]|nr:helix-turn-helix domain-containing protein [Clostridia bacterium]